MGPRFCFIPSSVFVAVRWHGIPRPLFDFYLATRVFLIPRPSLNSNLLLNFRTITSNQQTSTNSQNSKMISAFPICNNLGLYSAQQQNTCGRQELMLGESEYCMDKKFSVSSTSSMASFSSMDGDSCGLKRSTRTWRNLSDCLQS